LGTYHHNHARVCPGQKHGHGQVIPQENVPNGVIAADCAKDVDIVQQIRRPRKLRQCRSINPMIQDNQIQSSPIRPNISKRELARLNEAPPNEHQQRVWAGAYVGIRPCPAVDRAVDISILLGKACISQNVRVLVFFFFGGPPTKPSSSKPASFHSTDALGTCFTATGDHHYICISQ
jgi:hypothetical protein